MRTTLTLDDDVSALLDRLRRKGKGRLRDLVNEGLRRGLPQLAAPAPRGTGYRTPGVDLGRCLIGALDDVSEALAVSEGEDHR